jgi:hypothetical protein
MTMNRRTVWSLALAALVTAFMAVDASARTIVPTPNLSGTWRLDQRHSDKNFGRGFGNNAAVRDLALPRAIQITQGPNRLRVTNRQGNVVQVVLLDDHFGLSGRDRFGDNGRYGDNGPAMATTTTAATATTTMTGTATRTRAVATSSSASGMGPCS